MYLCPCVWPEAHLTSCSQYCETTAAYVDPDLIGGLVMEVIPQSSCLVFCPTKKNCENVAQLICNVLPK